MLAKPTPACAWARADDEDLGEAIRRLGALLGLPSEEVADLAEALTGRAWPECGPPELGRVLEELERLAEAVVARAARKRQARRRDRSHAART